VLRVAAGADVEDVLDVCADGDDVTGILFDAGEIFFLRPEQLGVKCVRRKRRTPKSTA